jgi:peptidoglycan/LPS O-acetylase OafA/YrhL
MAIYRLAHRWSQVPDAIATFVSITSLAILALLCGLLSPQSGGDFIVNGGAAPLIAIVVLAFSHPRCLSTQLLGCRPLAFLGGASYVVYMHAPLWHMFRAVSDRPRHASAQSTVKDWQFLLYLPLLLAVALLAQRLVERPAQRYLLKRMRLNTAPISERPVNAVTV